MMKGMIALLGYMALCLLKLWEIRVKSVDIRWWNRIVCWDTFGNNKGNLDVICLAFIIIPRNHDLVVRFTFYCSWPNFLQNYPPTTYLIHQKHLRQFFSSFCYQNLTIKLRWHPVRALVRHFFGPRALPYQPKAVQPSAGTREKHLIVIRRLFCRLSNLHTLVFSLVY